MDRLLAPALALLALLPLAHATGTVIAEGDILAGTPHTEQISLAYLGIQNVDGFMVDVGNYAGTTIRSETTDYGGAGYDVDFYVYDSGGSLARNCATYDSEETCALPTNAARLEVVGWYGADLHVKIKTV